MRNIKRTVSRFDTIIIQRLCFRVAFLMILKGHAIFTLKKPPPTGNATLILLKLTTTYNYQQYKLNGILKWPQILQSRKL
jgi:hypothetical protein